jgi:hypothetical protein
VVFQIFLGADAPTSYNVDSPLLCFLIKQTDTIINVIINGDCLVDKMTNTIQMARGRARNYTQRGPVKENRDIQIGCSSCV